jgi:hypothetical protein
MYRLRCFFQLNILFLLCGILLLSKPVQSGTIGGTTIADQVYSATYHFQFQRVDSLIKQNDIMLKSDLEYNLAVVNYYWYRLISARSNDNYSALISERIKSLSPLAGNSVKLAKDRDLFLLISVSAYKARVSLLDYSYVSALSDLSRYYSLLRISFGHELTYSPFFLTTGLYLFFTGYAKEKVPAFTPILNHYNAGNKEVGLQYLKIASSSDNWKVSQEAQYFLMKIYFDVYHNYRESAKYCTSLLAKYPENLLFQYYMLKISMGVNQVENARTRLTLLENAAERNKQLTVGEKLFYISESKKEIERKN